MSSDVSGKLLIMSEKWDCHKLFCRHVATVSEYGPEEENWANARHIVHCVNTHDDLLAALKAFEDYAEREHWPRQSEECRRIRDAARAAIDRAEGGEE